MRGIRCCAAMVEHVEEKHLGTCSIHIVPCGKFHRIGGAPPETIPSENYDAPEEVGGDRKCFDSPIRKLGLI